MTCLINIETLRTKIITLQKDNFSSAVYYFKYRKKDVLLICFSV